jgi:hypothetical protein
VLTIGASSPGPASLSFDGAGRLDALVRRLRDVSGDEVTIVETVRGLLDAAFDAIGRASEPILEVLAHVFGGDGASRGAGGSLAASMIREALRRAGVGAGPIDWDRIVDAMIRLYWPSLATPRAVYDFLQREPTTPGAVENNPDAEAAPPAVSMLENNSNGVGDGTLIDTILESDWGGDSLLGTPANGADWDDELYAGAGAALLLAVPAFAVHGGRREEEEENVEPRRLLEND